MARTYYLALVNKTDTTFDAAFARHDELVRGFTVSQEEGDFCGLTVTIEKPSQALLDPARKQWAWLSMEEGSALVPLFFGRVVGVPTDLQEDFVTIDFLAKPANFEAQKQTIAAGLRVPPFWDYAFIDPQMWADADTALEARTEVWDIDRVTNQVSATSILEGADGTLSITADLIPENGFALSYGDAPLRKVRLEMRSMWTQMLKGSIDITAELLAAFKAAGSATGFVTSYTGQGLYDDWPMEGDNLGNVYSFGPQAIEVADGKGLQRKYKSVSVSYDRAPTGTEQIEESGKMVVEFRRWGFAISCAVAYDIEIDRTEDISFEVIADVQDVVNDAEDQQSEIITMSSGNIGVLLGPGSAQEIPIGDTSRDTFFPSARGLQAIEFGLAHARALLLRRARAVEIKVVVPIGTAILASCRKSATVYHPEIPGGSATGKIVSYAFGVDGDSGSEQGSITIACLVGKSTAIAAVTGTPVWAEASYVGADYQQFTGAVGVSTDLAMTFSPPTSDSIQPVVTGVESVTVINGEAVQDAELSKRYIDVAAACDALNAKHTQVDLQMIAVDTSPRETVYYDTQVFLSIPNGIDLGAA
ncbi:MAG: hypothetical protein ABFD96_25400 [Armatimonadia bacterium]